MDVTNVFRAWVKTVKMRNKSAKTKLESTPPPNAQPNACPISNESRTVISSISQLRDFIFEHRADYINLNHMSSNSSTMTEMERDKIDSEAQSIIRKCRQLLANIKVKAESVEQISEQMKTHQSAIIAISEAYLKVICNIYSEQKAVRVKKAAEMKKLARLECLLRGSSILQGDSNGSRRSHIIRPIRSAPTAGTNGDGDQKERGNSEEYSGGNQSKPFASTAGLAPSAYSDKTVVGSVENEFDTYPPPVAGGKGIDEFDRTDANAGGGDLNLLPRKRRNVGKKTAPKKDGIISGGKEDSAGEAEKEDSTPTKKNNLNLSAMDDMSSSLSTMDPNMSNGGEEDPNLVQENEMLYRRMNTMNQELEELEGKVVGIGRLQEVFSQKVLEQDSDINRIHADTINSTENVKSGNQQLREAMQRRSGYRVWILFFLIVLTFTLLFLDWYNP